MRANQVNYHIKYDNVSCGKNFRRDKLLEDINVACLLLEMKNGAYSQIRVLLIKR